MKQGLYLIAPAGGNIEKLIAAFNDAKRESPDALLFDPAGAAPADIAKFRDAVQGADVAFIVKDDIETALKTGADGVQIAYSPDVKKIRGKTDGIALGVMCATRDEAMRAGETGADYIGFDGENAAEMTRWWSELFTVPCVDFNLDAPSPAADFKVAVLTG